MTGVDTAAANVGVDIINPYGFVFDLDFIFRRIGGIKLDSL
jgi:hypothetical protein